MAEETKKPTNDEDTAQEKEKKLENEKCTIQSKENQNVRDQDDAGPSQNNQLPGSIPFKTNLLHKPGLSKSEHSIRQIITQKDVANALNITSLSFSTQAHNAIRSLNLKELKLPIPTREITEESTTFIDLKKFMASCFKVKDTSHVVVNNEVQNVHPVGAVANEHAPNTSCVTSAQTDNIENVVLANEVIVTGAAVVAPIVSNVGAEKKKTSRTGSLSEKPEFLVAQRDSMSSIGSNVCRICMTRGRERLISPCNCKGSLANVHLSCLERWLNQVGRNHCELCGFSYPAIRTPRYTVVQALRLWFGNPRNRTHLQSDCLIFWLLSTVTAGLLAVCIVGTQYFVIEGNKFGISHRITETAMDFFMAIVLCGYFVTVYLLWKDHYVMWNRWRRTNVNVRLLLTPDSNPVPFVPRANYNVV
ncbi:uncharacterized protein isoform X2 [Choristoneura fumiferana]|uniref:uncharacterized protein isoform X2 n=1 Tax=Choristoneura fumiferana TaxID=7141 RepID=UPI003D15E36A